MCARNFFAHTASDAATLTESVIPLAVAPRPLP